MFCETFTEDFLSLNGSNDDDISGKNIYNHKIWNFGNNVFFFFVYDLFFAYEHDLKKTSAVIFLPGSGSRIICFESGSRQKW